MVHIIVLDFQGEEATAPALIDEVGYTLHLAIREVRRKIKEDRFAPLDTDALALNAEIPFLFR